MIIGIDLNDVLRNFSGRMEEIYNKYEIGDEVDLKENPMTDFDLLTHFPFTGGLNELNHFLYIECSLEVFGLAPVTHEHIMMKLNTLNQNLNDEEEHRLIIVSREANNSIPASQFFLAKNACKVDETKFYKKYEDLWERVDILITANPLTLAAKPDDKISVKVETEYNTDDASDYVLSTFEEFLEDEDVRTKILDSKNINIDDRN